MTRRAGRNASGVRGPKSTDDTWPLPLVPATSNWTVVKKAAATCRACPLWRNASCVVFGEGPSRAEILVVGEQSGDQEDRSGKAYFSGRLLVSLCQLAEFGEIHLGLHIDVGRRSAMAWEGYLDCFPHPMAPALRKMLRVEFTDDEQGQLETFLRPIIESGSGYDRATIA